MHTWQADFEINVDEVKTCLSQQFPDLLPLDFIQFMGEGWDNRVFLINKKIIFRFPRRKVSIELIENENTVLPKLQSRFALKIPNPIYQGKPCLDYPYPFQGYCQIRGITSENINQTIINANLKPLALFLKQLHSIDEKEALLMGAKPQVFNKTETIKSIEVLKDRVQQLINLDRYSIDIQQINQELESIQNLNLPIKSCLVHGDLHFKHLLFEKAKLSAIIDWGDLGINHPVVDLAIIWILYPKKLHADFFEVYGFVEQIIWCYARFLALYIDITFLVYGEHMGDTALVNAAFKSLQRINPKLIR